MKLNRIVVIVTAVLLASIGALVLLRREKTVYTLPPLPLASPGDTDEHKKLVERWVQALKDLQAAQEARDAKLLAALAAANKDGAGGSAEIRNELERQRAAWAKFSEDLRQWLEKAASMKSGTPEPQLTPTTAPLPPPPSPPSAGQDVPGVDQREQKKDVAKVIDVIVLGICVAQPEACAIVEPIAQILKGLLGGLGGNEEEFMRLVEKIVLGQDVPPEMVNHVKDVIAEKPELKDRLLDLVTNGTVAMPIPSGTLDVVAQIVRQGVEDKAKGAAEMVLEKARQGEPCETLQLLLSPRSSFVSDEQKTLVRARLATESGLYERYWTGCLQTVPVWH